MKDLKEIYQKAEQQKEALQKMANDAKNIINNSKGNKADIDFMQGMLNDAMSGKGIDIDKLNERVKNMTNGS